MRHIEQEVGLGHISLTRRLHSRQERNDYFPADLSEFGLYFGNEFAQHSFWLLLDVHLEAEIEGLDDGAASDTHEIAVRLIGIGHK